MGKPCHSDHNKTSGLTLLKTVQLHTFAIFGTSNLFSHKCWKYLRFASQNIAGHGDEEVVLEKIQYHWSRCMVYFSSGVFF